MAYFRRLRRNIRLNHYARMRNWGCEIKDWPQYRQRYNEWVADTLFLLYGSWLFFFILGMVFAVSQMI